MQHALPGSVLVHAAVLGIALLGSSWPEAEDAPTAESVSVSIITMSSVSANATEVIESDSAVDLVSSGMATSAPPMVEPVEPETVQPIAEPVAPLPSETRLPISSDPVPPTPVEAIEAVEPQPQEPVEADPQPPSEATSKSPVVLEPQNEVAILSSTVVSSLAVQPLAAIAPPTLEPLSSQDLKTAPTPQTLSFERPSRPTDPKPAPEQIRPPPPKAPQPSQSGNGGLNDADAVASAGAAAPQAGAGNGGDAKVARYPSEVLGKLRRALRSANGPRGEVVMRFTVLANGQVSGIIIGRSSGNAALDQAGIATVTRAAPFPPIPPQANRSNWTFDVPLAFGG